MLAHSVALTQGRLRKGHVLDANDLDQLAAAGVHEVTVARLDPGDVDENTAAAALAQAVGGQVSGLRIAKAFTGRANLIAEGPGVGPLSNQILSLIHI